MIDSHCHLNDPNLYTKAEAVLKAAIAVGVETIIVPGYDEESSRKSVVLANDYPMLKGAVGIHPHDCNSYNPRQEELLLKWGQNSNVVAIGEIGLDYHYEGFDKEKQKHVFIEQLELAKNLKKPVIIHTRDAMEDTLNILLSHGKGLEGVMHCFSGSVETALTCIDKLGFYISIAGPVTFKNARMPKLVAQSIPLERLLIETDAPYLTPHPFRGKQNEPKYLPYILESIVALREESYEVIEAATINNTKALFKC